MGRIAYDPLTPNIDESAFVQNPDWTDFYGNVVEELPANMPQPLGNSVTISAFVDANHAGNVVTRRSHTGIVIFVQNAPIIVYSKRQNTVEAATFGSEFVALRICKELIVALRYKLRMFGVPIEGPANVFCDNRGVVKNASVPESVLMKKHNAINYHAVREAAAAKILRVGKEDTETNLADLFTKVLTGQRRWDLCWRLMYNCLMVEEKPRRILRHMLAHGVSLPEVRWRYRVEIHYVECYRSERTSWTNCCCIGNLRGPSEM